MLITLEYQYSTDEVFSSGRDKKEILGSRT